MSEDNSDVADARREFEQFSNTLIESAIPDPYDPAHKLLINLHGHTTRYGISGYLEGPVWDIGFFSEHAPNMVATGNPADYIPGLRLSSGDSLKAIIGRLREAAKTEKMGLTELSPDEERVVYRMTPQSTTHEAKAEIRQWAEIRQTEEREGDLLELNPLLDMLRTSGAIDERGAQALRKTCASAAGADAGIATAGR